MISDYEPLVFAGVLMLTLLATIFFPQETKMNTMFAIQVVFFMWFMFHFVHSVM
ncbi:IMV membrane protein / putative virulence factor [Squirrelpox virus]|uniref:IMV membrane protein / putative virulence factor n=1 Tax=Squirrelpox virus TaxID=240426 RepID=U3UBK6_9POXV|nr:IMV membrane protein / putative virulence factor [Squirrelpox virus]CCD83286.1 IMV membrane protein / putative virulence factor [Squirrelpox virus]